MAKDFGEQKKKEGWGLGVGKRTINRGTMVFKDRSWDILTTGA